MIIFNEGLPPQSLLRKAITDAYRTDEATCVKKLLATVDLSPETLRTIEKKATSLIKKIRQSSQPDNFPSNFLCQYKLSSQEGIALMCLAEALLRVPDTKSIDELIEDKLSDINWQSHQITSDSILVNAATWGLLLTGKIYHWQKNNSNQLMMILKDLISRGSEPVIRNALIYAVKALGEQFIFGENIQHALNRAKGQESRGYCYSYDMLGEAAQTDNDAKQYYHHYQQAILAIGEVSKEKDYIASPGISVKLSALDARYEFSQREQVLKTVVPRLLHLAILAKKNNISLIVDAEEADKLDLSLDIIEKVFTSKQLKNWQGFGLAVQSYQKRALPVIAWLADLARRTKRRLMIRLIKGAYWDSEIKSSQVAGLSGYPVFTRKQSTDLSFLVCAQTILADEQAFYPMFATHNAYSAAAVMVLAGEQKNYEFQCLHGMGQALYDEILSTDNMHIPCRIYAPVGGYRELLAYLVRRLLENGANTAFVHRLIDKNQPITTLVCSPLDEINKFTQVAHPKIPLPMDLYGNKRQNSQGIDLTNIHSLQSLADELVIFEKNFLYAAPMLVEQVHQEQGRQVVSPQNRQQVIGYVVDSTKAQVDTAIANACIAFDRWRFVTITKRCDCLLQLAYQLENHYAQLISILIREGGKTIADAASEVREAVDFCRYYAQQATDDFSTENLLPGPTGEKNLYSYYGRGVIACISPWNFPLAIFVGQIAAALVAGNCVLAKPAEQTSLIAAYIMTLIYNSGVPSDVVQLLPGPGQSIGQQLVSHEAVNGVMFTGSINTAKLIQKNLANRHGAIVPLIAETGGINSMLVDSTALLEQVVVDIMQSAFSSAGQRCSALRILLVQDDIAIPLLELLVGAMAKMKIGDPQYLATDVGPVIDEDAVTRLNNHFNTMLIHGKLLFQAERVEQFEKGCFFAPCVFEIDDVTLLKEEVFGPFLHVVRFKLSELDTTLNRLNSLGYGLTLGIHSRIEQRIDHIISRMRVGNIYVNRNMIGAVVGVQPFGGCGLSGTGPKAGGPDYLRRLCYELSVSVNIAASGGNANLLALE